MPVLPRVRERLESITDPAILLSKDHRILAINQAYQEHYGDRVTPGKSRCFQISHSYQRPCDLEGETCPVRACLATGRPSQVAHLHHHGDHEEICNIELQPVEDGRGEVIQFIEILRGEPPAHRRGMIGCAPAFQRTLELIDAVAPSSVPVLLLGETGTGKERAAQAIHAGSERSASPFVAVECPGVQESLFESELFGHEKGAFTGAERQRDGLVDAARGGTLFLDEIGDLSLATQVKLLRLLEANTYRRVGSTTPIRADFRLIAATHRDLPAMVEQGTFRVDLYYRLAVYPIELPPLRERPEDIVPLARSLLAGRAPLTPAAAQALLRWRWPGNVRELRNAIDRAVVLAHGGPITVEHLPRPVQSAPVAHPCAEGSTWPWGEEVLPLDQVEAHYLSWAAEHEPSREALANKLGLSLRQLYRRLAKARSN